MRRSATAPATSAVACSNRRSTLIAELEARQRHEPRGRGLKGIIANLTDAIEQGQPVGTRLKERHNRMHSVPTSPPLFSGAPRSSAVT